MTPLEVVHGLLDREARFFDKLARGMSSGLTAVEDRYLADLPDGSSLPDSFDEECSVEEIFLLEAAEIMLASVWHWVERSLKKIALLSLTAPDRSGEARIARLNFPGLSAELNLPNNEDVQNVNLLRLIVNSWKHNPSEPSREVLDELGIHVLERWEYDDCLSLLGSWAVEVAVGDRLHHEIFQREAYMRCLSLPVAFKQIGLRVLKEAAKASHLRVVPTIEWWGIKRSKILDERDEAGSS